MDCKQPPACFKCKRTDHPTLLCPGQSADGEFMLFGYAPDDLGFSQMDLSEPAATPSLTALILVLGGKTASPVIIVDELRHLFRPDWDWEVTPISHHEFITVFPDPISLRYGNHSDELTLALNKLTGNISVLLVDPLAVATLSTVWIQICRLPSIAKKDRVVRNMSRILGKIVEADGSSLIRGAVVRAKVKAPDPNKLQTTIQMFFRDVGYDLRILVEGESQDAPHEPDGGEDPDIGKGRDGGAGVQMDM